MRRILARIVLVGVLDEHVLAQVRAVAAEAELRAAVSGPRAGLHVLIAPVLAAVAILGHWVALRGRGVVIRPVVGVLLQANAQANTQADAERDENACADGEQNCAVRAAGLLGCLRFRFPVLSLRHRQIADLCDTPADSLRGLMMRSGYVGIARENITVSR